MLGDARTPDRDLVAHVAVCRARAVVIEGRPREMVFGQVPRQWVLEALTADLEWAETHAPFQYLVHINACRAWQFAAEGAIVSKFDGAAWARERTAYSDVVDAAVRAQRGEGTEAPDPTRMQAMVEGATEALRRAGVEVRQEDHVEERPGGF